MFSFLTDAPVMVVRDFAAAYGLGVTPTDPFEHPRWADTLLVGRGTGLERVLVALVALGWKVDAWRPKQRATSGAAVGDPVFALAAASIERKRNGGSAPAAAFIR